MNSILTCKKLAPLITLLCSVLLIFVLVFGVVANYMGFSNNSGASWTYVPSGSFDLAVTNIRFSLSGTMNADTGSGNPYFDLNFRVRVK